MRIACRVITAPFMAIVILIWILFLWIKYVKNFILYGGAFIVYDKLYTDEK